LAARFDRNRARFIAIASRSGASAAHTPSNIAFGNSIARLTPRDVRKSTIRVARATAGLPRLAKGGRALPCDEAVGALMGYAETDLPDKMPPDRRSIDWAPDESCSCRGAGNALEKKRQWSDWRALNPYRSGW
jgi:hypothetical protein